jgi:hypothetical protein
MLRKSRACPAFFMDLTRAEKDRSILRSGRISPQIRLSWASERLMFANAKAILAAPASVWTIFEYAILEHSGYTHIQTACRKAFTRDVRFQR